MNIDQCCMNIGHGLQVNIPDLFIISSISHIHARIVHVQVEVALNVLCRLNIGEHPENICNSIEICDGQYRSHLELKCWSCNQCNLSKSAINYSKLFQLPVFWKHLSILFDLNLLVIIIFEASFITLRWPIPSSLIKACLVRSSPRLFIKAEHGATCDHTHAHTNHINTHTHSHTTAQWMHIPLSHVHCAVRSLIVG